MFELWAPEISGPRASAYYRETLTGAARDPKIVAYDEHRQIKRLSSVSV
jgi:hypothetical protein